MFKVSKSMSHQFRDAVPYRLRKQTDSQTSSVNIVFSGIKGIIFYGPKIWKILHHGIKKLENLEEFMRVIKQWERTSCPCRLCKPYIHRLGFVWYRVPFISFWFHRYFLFLFICSIFVYELYNKTMFDSFVNVN